MDNRDFSDRRRYRRVGFGNSVHFQFKDPKKFGDCLGCDISEGGIRVRLNDFVPLNTEMVMRAQLDLERIVDFMGKVVWVRQLPYSESYQAGLEFEELESIYETKSKIRQFIISK